MPSDYDKDAYPEPPRRTPVVDKQTNLPNPALILTKLFYYSVDLPVTTFRGNFTLALTLALVTLGYDNFSRFGYYIAIVSLLYAICEY